MQLECRHVRQVPEDRERGVVIPNREPSTVSCEAERLWMATVEHAQFSGWRIQGDNAVPIGTDE
jgi:hypothetical protein